MSSSRRIQLVILLILYNTIGIWGDCKDKGSHSSGRYYSCSSMTREKYKTDIANHMQSLTVRRLDLIQINLTTIDQNLFFSNGYNQVWNLTIQQCGAITIEDHSFDKFIQLDYLYILDNNIKYFNFQFINSKLEFLQWIVLSNNNIQQFNINCNHHGKLIKLIMNDNYLTTLRENSFRNCEKLTEVQICNSSIKEIQTNTFVGLDSLISLDLSNNPIARIDAGAFSGLSSISKINYTQIFGNIKNLKSGMFHGFENIKHINFSHSNIQSLEGRTFQGLKSLEFLDLDNNNISVLRAWTFADLPKLEFLSLNNNPIIEVEPHGFVNMPDYRILDLHKIFRHMKHIQEGFFDGIHNVTIMNLNNLNIYTIEPEAFEDVNFLESLFLNHNNMEALGTYQFSKIQKLQFLTLASNPIEFINPTAFFNLANLQHLNVSSTNISFLANGTFDSLLSLKILDLSFCKLTRLEIEFFCKSELYLNNNQIEYINIRAFGNLTLLNKLHLQFNKISYLETSVFSSLRQLRFLDLSHNKMSVLGESILQPLTALRQIDVSGNPWMCQHLTTIRKYFQSHGIAYHSKIQNFSVSNVGGIECNDNEITEVPELYSTFKTNLNVLNKNITTKFINRNESNKTSEKLLNNRNDSNDITTNNSTLNTPMNNLDTKTFQEMYTIIFLLFILFIGYLCLKMVCFICKIYKKCCLRKSALQVHQNTHNEMVPLNGC